MTATTSPPTRPAGPPGVEVGIAAIALVALMLLEIALVKGSAAFTRPLWLDEYHTLFLTSRESLTESIRSLASGSDFNPPVLFLITRGLGVAMGGLTPVKLRIISFVAVWLALVVVYALLRKGVSRDVAFVGAFALWTHPLVVTHAFEARFYGPMLLFSAVLAYAVGMNPDLHRSPRRDLLMAGSSALLCGTHYFGAFVWILVAVSAIALSIGRGEFSWRRFVPLLAGPVVLIICLPIYAGQRGVLGTRTWVEPLSATQLREVFGFFYGWFPFVWIVLAEMVRRLLWPRDADRSPRSRWHPLGASAVGLLALGALPVVIALFSLVAQPALISRYAIAALLMWPPIIAFALTGLPPLGRIAALGLMAVASLGAVARRVSQDRLFAQTVSARATLLRQMAGDSAVVVAPTRHILYPVAAVAAAAGVRLVYPEFSDAGADAGMMVEREVARVHARLYGVPALISAAQLARQSHFYILAADDELPGGATSLEAFARKWFPNHRVRRLTPGLAELVLAPGRA